MGSRGTSTTSTSTNSSTLESYKPLSNMASFNVVEGLKDTPAWKMTGEKESITLNGEEFKPYGKTSKYNEDGDDIYESVYKSVNNFTDPRDGGERPATISITVKKHTTKSGKEKYSYVTKGLNKTRMW